MRTRGKHGQSKKKKNKKIKKYYFNRGRIKILFFCFYLHLRYGGEDLTYGLGSGPRCSGLHGILGQDEANFGLVDIKLVDIKNLLAQVKEPQASHVGLKTFGATKLGYDKKTKSPTRKKSHAHAKKLGKEIVGENTSKE